MISFNNLLSVCLSNDLRKNISVDILIDRGSDELFMMQHDQSWIVQRYVLYERGIRLAGPALQTIIDPVSPGDLRQVMLVILKGWAAQILENPSEIR